jgi:hypothetical protein
METSVRTTFINTCVIVLFIALSSFSLKSVIGDKKIKTEQNGFVVLELFTSQGCSSCPPADVVLGEYAAQDNPNIIPLAFHVDYWNYIGWKDPFSKGEFTNRQRNYASLLNAQGNYTPQLVINGKHELVGSYKNEIKNFVKEELALKNKYTISIKSAIVNQNVLTIDYETDIIAASNIVNIALVKKKEFTSIKRGENKGLNQTNYNIVYDFKSNAINTKSNNKSSFKFNPEWQKAEFIAVAYVQNTKTGQILTATKALIN